MSDDLLIGISENRISKYLLFQLREILDANPGETKVIVKVLKTDNTHHLLELKSIKVNLNLDLYLEIMEIY